jgi:hypothetical protein
LLIGIIFNLIIITLGPLLLLYFLFTSLSIGGRRITPFRPCAALRGLLSQCLLHCPQRGGVMPSLGPPLSGGLFHLTPYLHPHDLGERGGSSSNLEKQCRSLISTPWSPQTLTHTLFGQWKAKIAQGGEEREKGRAKGEGGSRSTR